MKIAVITSTVAGQIDQLISETALKLQSEGVRLAGVAKVLGDEQQGDGYCDMDIRVLPDGPEIRITQSLGQGSTGCRLNPAGIVEAVAQVERIGSKDADLFVLNKFGPQEAEGRGFCDAIASALETETPVLVGVGKGCRDSLDRFVDNMAEVLPPEPEEIYAWCKAAISHR